MTTRRQNFTEQDTPSIIDTDYENCNFAHEVPVDSGGGVFIGVRLFPGDNTARTFTRCNLVNCEVPPGSTVTKCNTTIRQAMVVTGTSKVTIDSVETTITHHKNVIHGRWTPSGYEYKGTPEDIQKD